METIPLEIINLAGEATSDHNDGWTKQGARGQLIKIRDYINNVLGETGDTGREEPSALPSLGEDTSP